MSGLTYKLTYFKEQIGFWEGLEPDMRAVCDDLAAIPDIDSWWPGLEEYFSGDQARAINAVVDDFSEMVGEGGRAADSIADLLSQSALDYARTEAANEAEARRMWSEVVQDEPPPTLTPSGGGGGSPAQVS